MAKYYGSVGFAITEELEDSPGDWEAKIVERQYYGDVIRNRRSWKSTSNLNDDTVISNEISILADPFAYRHMGEIRYVTWMGTKWRVANIDVNYPSLNLSIGDVYNDDSGPAA